MNNNIKRRDYPVKPRSKPFYEFVKRVFDVVLSAIALVILSPLFLVVTLLVRRDGGPAFFRQVRVGKDGKTFMLYKFRQGAGAK